MKSIYLTIAVALVTSFTFQSKSSSVIQSVKYTSLTKKDINEMSRTYQVYVLNESDYSVTAVVQKNEYWAGTSKKTEEVFRLKPGQEKYVGKAHSGDYSTPGGTEFRILRDYKGWD